MRNRFPRLLLVLLLCAALLMPTFALAEEDGPDMEPIEQCAHAHTQLVVDPQLVKATTEGVEDPATQHKAHYENYQRTYCQDCGTYLSAGHPLEDSEALEYHRFDENSKCVDCGYQCYHPNMMPTWHEEDNTYAPSTTSPAYHTVSGTRVTYDYCPDCGLRLNETSAPFTETRSHYFYDNEGNLTDTCAECGFTCTHANTYTDWYWKEEPTYENVNDTFEHKISGIRVDYTRCSVCNKELSRSESPYSEMESHEYYKYDNNQGSYVDTCVECGYKCTHPTTSVDYDYSGKTYVNVGSQYRHRVAGTKTVSVKCSQCWQTLSESTVDASYFESHDFNEKGVCQKEGCGYACPHEHVHTDTDYDYDDENYTYKDTGDNKTHLRTRKVKQSTWCDDCGKRVGDPVEVSLEETVEHYYPDNGVCERCGHANTCTHPNKEARRYDDTDYKYEKYDNADFHHYTYTILYRDYCPDCGMWVSSETVKEEKVTEDRPHEFSRKGVCYDCGYVKNCTHPNAFDREGGWSDKSTYEDTGSNATHLRCMDGWTEKYCPDCCRWLGNEQPLTIKEEENHDYDANGVCKLCNHKNVCEHKRTSKFDRFKTTTGYTAIDENTHSRNGLKQTVLYCEDCQTDIEILSSEASSETEAHNFGWNNICQECGYQTKCKHANVVKDYGGDFEDYDAFKYVDEKTHLVAGWYYTYDFCLDCGAHIDDHSKYEIKTKSHSFDQKGVCDECGYKRECQHANLGGWEMYSTGRATYKNIGHRLVHEVTPVISRRVYCEDCGKLIEDEIIASDETVLLSHSFDKNGVCMECGYVSDNSACAHANTVTNTYFKGAEYAKDTGSDATHEVVGRQMVTAVYCKDCGRIISETTKPFGKATLSHYYENGVCWQCGHVNKCAHANTETKATIVGRVKDTGNNKTHLETGYKFETVTCKDCGATLSSKLVSKDASEKIAHKYVDDLCILCGHVKTKEKAEENAAITEGEATAEAEVPAEIVYTAVSEDTVVNGVKVADKLPMVEALVTVGKTLDDDIKDGSNVTVDIVGVEKVLNAEEKAKLDKLPVRERMLVVLNALGLGDAIGKDAMEGMSDEAKALTEQISARMESMSDAEKQALLNIIAEFFPKTTVTVDGKTFEAFSIDVVIDRDGKKEYDRYTFYNDGAQWMLYSIEVGKPVEAA